MADTGGSSTSDGSGGGSDETETNLDRAHEYLVTFRLVIREVRIVRMGAMNCRRKEHARSGRSVPETAPRPERNRMSVGANRDGRPAQEEGSKQRHHDSQKAPVSGIFDVLHSGSPFHQDNGYAVAVLSPLPEND